ncbi:MAG: ATP-binding protein, partial [Clostridiales bacterium]|nr:ATP-binding protein [Candidatus Coliplasma equi]
ANKGYNRYYFQSAYGFSDESKQEQERVPLRNIPDAFERIIVTGDSTLPYRDDNGYKIDNLINFLLNDFS